MKYKIIVDKQPRNNPSAEKKEYEIDIEELRVKGDVYDSLIITKEEDYVMRRLFLSEYEVLTELEKPKKENIPSLNIELFEGDNYIYLIDMTGNKFYAEYLIKNDFTDLYVTQFQMNSAITQTSSSILNSVNATFATKTELDDTKKTLSASLELKINTKDLISEINASADQIKLKAGRLIIESGNFQLNEQGILECSKAILNNGKLLVKDEGEIAEPCINISKLETTNDELSVKANSWGIKMRNFMTTGSDFSTDISAGEIFFQDEGNNYNKSTASLSYNLLSMGHIDEQTSNIHTLLASYDYIRLSENAPFDEHETSKVIAITTVESGGITTPKLTQTSLASIKKNIEKLDIDAIELVKNADICLYNLKGEKKGAKKHLGLVIGEGYNCPDIVISENGEGIEQYSYTSLLYKAFQLLIKRVEKLEGIK